MENCTSVNNEALTNAIINERFWNKIEQNPNSIQEAVGDYLSFCVSQNILYANISFPLDNFCGYVVGSRAKPGENKNGNGGSKKYTVKNNYIFCRCKKYEDESSQCNKCKLQSLMGNIWVSSEELKIELSSLLASIKDNMSYDIKDFTSLEELESFKTTDADNWKEQIKELWQEYNTWYTVLYWNDVVVLDSLIVRKKEENDRGVKLDSFELIHKNFLQYLAGYLMVRYMREKAVSSAILVIMSRNGSHNIGSHVINRVVESIDTLNVQDHRIFLRYLQQRMDFLAQISTADDANRPASGHWFVKEIMKGLYEQRHLLNFIARSEGLKGYDGTGPITAKQGDREQIQCLIKRVKKYACNGGSCESTHKCANDCEHAPDRRNKPVLICDFNGDDEYCDVDLKRDLMVAVPGGVIGFHAFYTILENFTRNTAKHCYANHPIKGRNLNIRVEIWDYACEPEYYTIRVWDDYSYISGLIENDILCKKPDFKQSNKIHLIIPVYNSACGIQITDIPEKEDKTPEYDITIAAKNEANNIVDGEIYFIVDDGGSFRENDRYETLMKKSNVRFVEGAYWDSFCKHHGIDGIDKNRSVRCGALLEFFGKYLVPSHCLINKTIMESMIRDNGELNKANWGIGEMKITAGYLAGRSTKEIGDRGKDNLEKLVKAIAVPEYKRNDDNGKACGVTAYRLGYKFRIRQPVDLLVIGDDNCKEVRTKARNHGIVLMDYRPDDESWKKSNARMVVLRNPKSTPTHPLIDILKKALTGDPKAREKVWDLIEDFGRFSIFVVSDELAKNWQDKTKNDTFIRKRVVCLTEQEFQDCQGTNDETGAEDRLKRCLYEKWITHLIKNVRNDLDTNDKKIKLLFSAAAETDSSGSHDAHIYKVLIAGILKLTDAEQEISGLKTDDDFLDAAESIWQKWGKTEFSPKDVKDDIPGVVKTQYSNGTAKTFQMMWNNRSHMIDDFPSIVKDFFGIGNTAYIPPTVPEVLRAKAGAGNDAACSWPENTPVEAIKDLPEKEARSATIIYQRHMPDEVQKNAEEYLYAEDLSGAAPHFAQLASPPDSKGAADSFFIGQLIENGLLRIAVADERVYEAVIKNGRGRKELGMAGVSFIRQVLDYEITTIGQGDEDVHDLVDNGNGLDLPEAEILIIHQGIIDKLDRSLMPGDGDKVAGFIRQIKDTIPYVVVTSGRGEPENLPEHVKFVAFSIIESSLLSRPHSKYNLIRQII